MGDNSRSMRSAWALAVLAGVAQAFYTCSHGSAEHDWMVFEGYMDKEQHTFLKHVAGTLTKKAATYPQFANIPECLAKVTGLTVGWHAGDDLNGVDRDDHITRIKGCENAQHICIHDGFARAIALIECSLYSQRGKRTYEIGAGATFGVVGRWFTGTKTYRSSDRCGSKYTLDYVLSATGRTEVCWGFVRDCVDLYCHFVAETPALVALLAQDGTDIEPFSCTKSETPEFLVEGPLGDSCYADMAEQANGRPYKFHFAETNSQKADKRKMDVVAAIDVSAPPKFGIDSATAFGEKEYVVEYDRTPKQTVTILPHSNAACLGKNKAVCGPALPEDMEAVMKPKKANPMAVPFADFDRLEHKDWPKVPTQQEEEAAAATKSQMSGNSKSSGVSTTGSSIASMMSVNYSRKSLIAAVNWLDSKLGAVSNLLSFPLKLLVCVAEAVEFGLSRVVLANARFFQLCPDWMSDADCMCKVIDPIVNAIKDLWDFPPPLEGSNKAVTLNFGLSSDGHISVLGGTKGAGIYITVYWMKAGRSTLGLEVGGYSGKGAVVSLGTDAISVGTSYHFHFGVFFGFESEKSEWSKGVNFGLDLGLRADIHFSILFRKEYLDINFQTRCAPLDYSSWSPLLGSSDRPVLAPKRGPINETAATIDRFGGRFLLSGMDGVSGVIDKARLARDNAGRFLLLPVNPFCARGFQIAIQLGTGVGKVFNFNVYTALETSKTVATGMVAEKGSGVQILKKVDEAVTAEKREIARQAELAAQQTAKRRAAMAAQKAKEERREARRLQKEAEKRKREDAAADLLASKRTFNQDFPKATKTFIALGKAEGRIMRTLRGYTTHQIQLSEFEFRHWPVTTSLVAYKDVTPVGHPITYSITMDTTYEWTDSNTKFTVTFQVQNEEEAWVDKTLVFKRAPENDFLDLLQEMLEASIQLTRLRYFDARWYEDPKFILTKKSLYNKVSCEPRLTLDTDVICVDIIQFDRKPSHSKRLARPRPLVVVDDASDIDLGTESDGVDVEYVSDDEDVPIELLDHPVRLSSARQSTPKAPKKGTVTERETTLVETTAPRKPVVRRDAWGDEPVARKSSTKKPTVVESTAERVVPRKASSKKKTITIDSEQTATETERVSRPPKGTQRDRDKGYRI
eukprot:c38899_g1_i1.p1 GENE.c38899_g1_i1~~c38899_g1_i1.p1  ORF type:complete len:1138 (-),score=209.99 c38899_g1_i1:19-3432(-)